MMPFTSVGYVGKDIILQWLFKHLTAFLVFLVSSWSDFVAWLAVRHSPVVYTSEIKVPRDSFSFSFIILVWSTFEAIWRYPSVKATAHWSSMEMRFINWVRVAELPLGGRMLESQSSFSNSSNHGNVPTYHPYSPLDHPYLPHSHVQRDTHTQTDILTRKEITKTKYVT